MKCFIFAIFTLIISQILTLQLPTNTEDPLSDNIEEKKCANINCSCRLVNFTWTSSLNICPKNINQCYKKSKCIQKNDNCSYSYDKTLRDCLTKSKFCMVGGCSGELCLEKTSAISSICLWKPEFQCYKTAKCEVQTNGKCGWTNTDSLKKCLKSYETTPRYAELSHLGPFNL